MQLQRLSPGGVWEPSRLEAGFLQEEPLGGVESVGRSRAQVGQSGLGLPDQPHPPM